MQRTVRLKLLPDGEQRAALLETIQQQTECFNAVAEFGWKNALSNGVALHRETYRALRQRFPDLPSQLVCSSRVRATEALKATLKRKKRGLPTSQPKSNRLPIRYDARSYRLCFRDGVLRISTVAGRLPIRFQTHAHAQAWLDRATEFDSADLIVRDGKFYLHLVVTVLVPEVAMTDEVVGVDLGLNRPAVTSNNRFFGKRRWKAIEHRYFQLRRKLQAKGTPSARRHLRSLRRKVERFRRDCDHVLSKRIVQSVKPGATIVLEDLTDIHTRVKRRDRKARRRMQSWSVARIRTFLEYKAEHAGCRVTFVDPRHTSQRCSRCGFTARGNRKSQARFVCRECGFELNADLNGARNVAWKHLAGGGMSVAGGSIVNRPIVLEDQSVPLNTSRLSGS